jgi:hypothetical protein
MSQFSDLAAFFGESGVAAAIRESDTLFPFIESVHVVAICLVVGSIFALDLRLLGFASVGRPVSRLANAIAITFYILSFAKRYLLHLTIDARS